MMSSVDPLELAVDPQSASDDAPLVLRSARAREVYGALLKAILDHRLAPGTRLPEGEVGGLFGASRTLVRSALQALAHQRLVTIEPNRGAAVARPTAAEARQVFEARALIEPRVASLAAGAMTGDAADRLRDHARLELEAIAANDNGRAILLSGQFHMMIADIADHAIFAGFVRELVSRSSLVVALYWRRRDTTCERHAHDAIINALEQSDGSRSSELMLSHLVDILSGLDLTAQSGEERPLAELLMR